MASDLTSLAQRCSAVAVASLALQGLGFAEAKPPMRSRCEIGAFVQETDPAGLNVRAAPRVGSAVLGTIVPVFVDPEQGYRTRAEVDVLASENGWFLIRNARDNPDMSGQPARPMYAGEGWVSGTRLIIKSQSKVGRAAPQRQAPETVRFQDNQSFDSSAMMDSGRLIGCDGKWAHVEFAEATLPAVLREKLRVKAVARLGLPPGRFRAWVDQVCDLQETSCSGLGGDEP